MSKTVTIPSEYNPFKITVNNTEYSYKAGDTVTVPDDVAEVIEHFNDSKPVEVAEKGVLGQVWTKKVKGADWADLPEDEFTVPKIIYAVDISNGEEITDADFLAFIQANTSRAIIIWQNSYFGDYHGLVYHRLGHDNEPLFQNITASASGFTVREISYNMTDIKWVYTTYNLSLS